MDTITYFNRPYTHEQKKFVLELNRSLRRFLRVGCGWRDDFVKPLYAAYRELNAPKKGEVWRHTETGNNYCIVYVGGVTDDMASDGACSLWVKPTDENEGASIYLQTFADFSSSFEFYQGKNESK